MVEGQKAWTGVRAFGVSTESLRSDPEGIEDSLVLQAVMTLQSLEYEVYWWAGMDGPRYEGRDEAMGSDEPTVMAEVVGYG